MLIDHGADVEARSKEQSTPLHLASFQGQVEAVAQMLINHGADMAAQSEHRSTPLHLALRKRGNKKLSNCLLSAAQMLQPVMSMRS
jgi:ankyrin repeat protein